MNGPGRKESSQIKMLLESLHDCRNKLYCALGNTMVGTTDDKMIKCHRLADLPADQREDYVMTHWTGQDFNNVRYLLVQLAAIERVVTRERAKLDETK